MTKRLLSVAIAILMVLAIVPMTVFAAESDAHNAVTYSAVPEDAFITDPQVGDTFRVAYNVSADSGMWGGLIYARFDNRYITTKSYDGNGAGTLARYINNNLANGEGYENSLVVMSTPDVNYQGGTGEIGEEGETYSVFTWLSTAQEDEDGNMTDGIYSGGTICFVTYQWVAIPEADTTLDFHVLCPISYCNEGNGVPTVYHDNVTCVDASIPVHISGSAPAVEHTIDFTLGALPVNATEGTPAATATFDNPTVGDFVWIYLNVSTPEGGQWCGFHGYIDFDENFFAAAANSNDTTEGFLQETIQQMLNSGDYSSDLPGGTPQRNNTTLIPGNTITNLLYAIQDFTPYANGYGYPGVTLNGDLCRIRYRLKTVPTKEQLQQDENGYYLEMPFYILVSDEETGSLDCRYYDPNPNNTSIFAAENIHISNVKLYFNIAEEPTTHTITYTLTGEEYATQTYNVGDPIVVPEYTVPEGYTFSGWNVPATMPDEDITVDATLIANTYTVTYTINGEEYTTQTYTYGETITAPEYTVPEGYTFSGWNVPANMPAEDITLDATLTPINYTITVQYLRYSDALQDWVALQTAQTITMPYGSLYDVSDMIPETIGEYALVEVIGDETGNVTGNITIEAHYAIPYEPVAPTVASTRVELRERATEDAKKDVRFVFTVTFNDSIVKYNNEMVGHNNYFEITAIGATITVGSKSVTIPAKNIWAMFDDSFEFTAVVSGISEKNWATTMTAVPYMTYVPVDGEAVTVYGNAIEATVNSLLGGE